MWAALFLMVRRSLRQHALSSAITACSVALASGLTMSVFSIQGQTRAAFAGGDIGFDAVLGGRGSPLQLVLNSVFHLETSPGNIPWSLYENVRQRPGVQLAIPYATGDNYAGFRIVGTTEEIFTRYQFQRGRRFEMAEGRPFDPDLAEAVLGSFVAARTGLRPGDHFHPSHGVYEGLDDHHEDEYTVVGIMAPTNTPADRVIWIPVEGIFWMDGHVLRGAGETFTPEHGHAIPEAHKELSAVMLKLAGPAVGWQLAQEINREGTAATLAFPITAVVLDLFEKLGWMSRVLELVAYLIIVVSAGAILASIYNTINERRREFAILRAIGARRRVIFAAVVSEAAAIAALGSLGGLAVSALILSVAAAIIHQQTGVVVEALAYHPAMVLTPLCMVLLGALAGFVPAWKAYRAEVAENLSPLT